MSETWQTPPSPVTHDQLPNAPATLAGAQAVVQRLRARLRAAIIGRDEVIDLIVIALLADGHVLLEDYPGSGKTTLARALGEALIDDGPHDEIVAMRRIQFTPDLMPSDVTGTTIFDPESNRFFFRPGPIFAHIVLADEINRTSPKVQAALLEAMAEKQVTIDNQTHRLDELFLVIATQNPLDLAGTFPLPAAQLDRFLFKIRMTHISRDAELIVLKTLGERKAGAAPASPGVTRSEVLAARAAIERDVFVSDAIQEALVDIAERTRNDDRIVLGTSTRSLVLAVPALRARALVVGRDFVAPDDVAYLAPLIFAHRIETAPGVEDAAAAVRECCEAPLEKLARASLHTLRRG